jgi:hypothetical protein
MASLNRAYDLSQGFRPGVEERRGIGATAAALAKSRRKPLPTARPFAFRRLV